MKHYDTYQNTCNLFIDSLLANENQPSAIAIGQAIIEGSCSESTLLVLRKKPNAFNTFLKKLQKGLSVVPKTFNFSVSSQNQIYLEQWFPKWAVPPPWGR